MPPDGPPDDLFKESIDDLEVSSEHQTEQKQQKFGDKRTKKGPLLRKYEGDREAEKKLAKLHLKMWTSMDIVVERARAQHAVNVARRAGITNAKVLWRGSRSGLDEHWTAWLPKNASPDTTPDTNKAATLCRRMTSQMFIDPFVAEVSPEDGDDDDAAAAELSQRALHSLQSESGLNEAYKQRKSFDRSHSFGSGFIYYWVDQRGGGQRAVQVEARADALNAQLAFVDPATGQEGPEVEVDAQGQQTEKPYVQRFVSEAGDFVDDPNDAAVEYLPKLDSEVLDSRYIRLIPHTCSDIWDAQAFMHASMPTWGEVKLMVPKIRNLPMEDIKKLLGFRPKFWGDLVVEGNEDAQDMKLVGDTINDERRVFVLTSYHLRSDEYEDGVYLTTIGGEFVLHRSVWIDESDGEKRALDLPLTQHAGFEEGRDGWWKVGLMEIVGPGNEVRAAQLSGLLDHLEKLNSRKTFLPTNSIIDPRKLLSRRQTILEMNAGGKPEYEDIPAWPADSYTMYEEQGRGMDEASGLREKSGPQAQSNVKSGRHEFALISESHAGLAEPRQNMERAYLRSCRIALQLARAFFPDEMTAKYGGESGGYRLAKWRGSDLDNDPDIRIKPGSGTMLAPAAKAQLAERYAGLGVIDQDDLREIITSNIGGTVGLQDNPHRLRIKRQISQWEEGPPDGWQPMQPEQPAEGQPPSAPGTQMGPDGVPVLVDEVLTEIWDIVPADTLPIVAAVRLKQIADSMAGAKYRQLPPEWRVGPDTEFARMGMSLQAMQEGDPTGEDPEGPADGEGPAPVNKDGSPMNDLQEDALQEGARPEMVV